MRNLSNLGRGVALAALLAISATPAFAGKEDRAKRAIAEAQGKIDAAEKAGTGGEAPGIIAQANSALRTAKEDLAADHNTSAIQAANRASTLADTAIGVANKQRIESEQAQRDNTAAAQLDASASAQEAAAAQARANAAEQAAATATAQAEALRNAPPVTAVVTTTETTKQASSSSASAPKKKVVRKTVARPAAARSATTEKTTTTTVTTAPATTGL
jgi:hypothetical protein